MFPPNIIIIIIIIIFISGTYIYHFSLLRDHNENKAVELFCNIPVVIYIFWLFFVILYISNIQISSR